MGTLLDSASIAIGRLDGIALVLPDPELFIDTNIRQQAVLSSQIEGTLKAEIDADAWATLNSDTSRPFEKPKSGCITVKVINHLGDEVMKVFRV